MFGCSNSLLLADVLLFCRSVFPIPQSEIRIPHYHITLCYFPDRLTHSFDKEIDLIESIVKMG
jgi:hypothetical protein